MSPAQYRIALDKIVQAFVALILRLLRSLFKGNLTDERTRQRRIGVTAKLIVVQVRLARKQVAELAGEYLQEQGKAQGYPDVEVPPLAGYSEHAVRTTLESAVKRHLDGDWTAQKSVEATSATFVRHVENAGRQMIVDAVEPEPDVEDVTVEEAARQDAAESDKTETDKEADAESLNAPEKLAEVVPEREMQERRAKKQKKARPVAWARGLTGDEDCAFCVMLASRGAIYKSKASAKFDVLGVLYHDNCDCVPIPVYTSADWPGKDEADALYRFWQKSTKGYYQEDAINALRRELYRRKKANEPIIPARTRMRDAA